MYTYPTSALDFQTRFTNDRHEMEAQEAIFLAFMYQLDMQEYQPGGFVNGGQENHSEPTSLADSLRVKLKGRYQYRNDGELYGVSYHDANTELLMDYVVEKLVDGTPNCRINLKHWTGNTYHKRGVTFSSYYEAENAEEVIWQVVDFMVNDKRFDRFQVSLRKYKIDGILKDLEENC